jgi:uncharacterized damage-inducible protein DinB
MNKDALLGQRGYFKLVHGVTLKLIGSFSDADLDYRPKPGMRSVRDLILHIYGAEKALTEGALAGKVSGAEENKGLPESEEAKPILASLKTVADAQAFAVKCHDAADAALSAISEEQLAKPVESPFGTFLGWQYFNFAYDEHWHHRGQLYTYARLLGNEPPVLYDYGN